MTTSKRVCLSKMVVALAMGLMFLAPLGAAIDSSRASVDLRIVSSNISVSPGHPNVGDVVKITAYVENEGASPATADVLFWDVSLGKAVLIAEDFGTAQFQEAVPDDLPRAGRDVLEPDPVARADPGDLVQPAHGGRARQR
jgi:hypothetical protein